MKQKSSRWVRILLPIAAEALVIFGAWWGFRHETAAVNQAISEVSDLRDPSPFRAALMAHLGKIHLGLEGYLRSPDLSLDKQIVESRKDFDMLLPEFARQNPKLFPQVANEEIKRTFGLYKEAIDHTLEANRHRMDSRAGLNANFTRILYLIAHELRPIIRKDQADGSDRGEAILNIENQTRAWQQNLALAWDQPSESASSLAYENENRGETYLELYSNMELLARERKVLHQIRALWQANNNLARESFVKETLVLQAQKTMDAERQTVIGVLNKFLPALPPREMDEKKGSILSTMRLHLAGAAGIVLLVLGSLATVVIGVYRLWHQREPIADGVYRATPADKAAEEGKAPEARVQMDLKGQITDWSPGAEALYGFSAADMLGLSIAKIFESESEIGRLGKELQKAKRTTFDTTHKTKTGALISVRIEFHPVADASGHATAISLICTRR